MKPGDKASHWQYCWGCCWIMACTTCSVACIFANDACRGKVVASTVMVMIALPVIPIVTYDLTWSLILLDRFRGIFSESLNQELFSDMS